MLSKIARFGLAFTVTYVVLVTVANAVLGTNIPVTLFPQFTSDAIALGVVAGILTWLYVMNYYEPVFSLGGGIIGTILTAVLMGFIIAIVSAILGAVLYSIMASMITNIVWFAIYAVIQVPLNGLALVWLTSEGGGGE